MNFTCGREAKALASRTPLEGHTWPIGLRAQGPQRSVSTGGAAFHLQTGPPKATKGHKAPGNKRIGLTKESLQLCLLVFVTA